ncbi:hypothetical protein [Lactococcus formosensis]|uniref:hypothetical protein n=1 Tax=Lactococcus formosensis TaxID=1281486 RepID=UPI00254A4B57|nr:hypothetical protein [Lactococcus formosensis]
MKHNTPQTKKPIYKRIWFWILVAVIVIGVGGALGGGSDDKKDSSTSSSTETKQSSKEEKSTEQSSSEKPKNGWTQEIYDSITVAKMDFDANGNMSYSGGTPYADIEAKVGKPDSSSETSVGDQTTVTATWSSVSWTKGTMESITVQYDKTSGQITSKNKFNA